MTKNMRPKKLKIWKLWNSSFKWPYQHENYSHAIPRPIWRSKRLEMELFEALLLQGWVEKWKCQIYPLMKERGSGTLFPRSFIQRANENAGVTFFSLLEAYGPIASRPSIFSFFAKNPPSRRRLFLPTW